MIWSLGAYANTRELAAVSWALVLVVLAFSLPQSRQSTIVAAKSLMKWKVLVSLGAYALFLFAVVFYSSKLGIWTPKMLGSTIVWFVVSGLVLYVNALTRGSKTVGFFRKHLLDTVRLTVVFEFVVNLHTFDLWAELILFPAIAFLVMLQAFAQAQKEGQAASNIVTGLLVFVALGLFIATVVSYVTDPGSYVLADVLRDFALPIWLALASIPFAYLAALLSGYETLMNLLGIFANRSAIPMRVRLGIISGLGMNLQAIDKFAGNRGKEAVDAGTFRGARNEVKNYFSELRTKNQDKAAAKQRLQDLSGVIGYDDEHRWLDRREFRETKDALEWLGVCHAGHYLNKDRFSRELLSVINSFENKGLPDPHGIVMKVRKDGQAWFAYRQTASGFHFGIGAVGDPNHRWYFDGEQPPSGYPTHKGGWSEYSDKTRTEWRGEPLV